MDTHTTPFRRRAGLWGCFLAVLLAPLAAGADRVGFERFVGEYGGEAISETGGEIGKRDIGVKIVPRPKGFTVTWTTIIRKADGEVRRSETSVNFQPTKREGIYGSAMRTDAFGNPVALDPLRGDPYVWARIDGATLTVHALIITDEGGYEMQVYERTLTPLGLDLKYSRVRDGEVLRTVTGKLRKVR